VINVTQVQFLPAGSGRIIGTTGRMRALTWMVLACAQAVAAAAAPVAEVRIIEYRFDPAEITVAAGTTVRWINAERRTSHSILFQGESTLESERIFPGDHWERRFDLPGTFEYGCGPHPEMRGRVTVSGASAALKPE
jgi:plastocyanin